MGYQNREPEEDTGSVQTFAVTEPDNADMDVENPDLMVDKQMQGDYNAAEVMAIETAMINAQNEYIKSQKEQKNYPRIDVMVDKNCLISYTGHMVDFDYEGFMEIIDKVLMARIDIEALVNERVKNMPKQQLEQTGYQ